MTLNYDVLHEYATLHRLDYNELCAVVRKSLTPTLVPAVIAPTPKPRHICEIDPVQHRFERSLYSTRHYCTKCGTERVPGGDK